MALTMSNATYARSTTGMNALKNDLQNDIQKTLTALWITALLALIFVA